MVRCDHCKVRLTGNESRKCDECYLKDYKVKKVILREGWLEDAIKEVLKAKEEDRRCLLHS